MDTSGASASNVHFVRVSNRDTLGQRQNWHGRSFCVCDCRSLSEFRLQRKVGEGQNSTVYHAVHCSSETVVALKVYAKCTLTAVTRRQVQREIEIQGRLDHEHIAKLVRQRCAESN